MLKITSNQPTPALPAIQARYVTATNKAVTGLAFDVRDALRRGMQQAFDKPRPFTLNAFRVAAATGPDHTAVVWAMPLQARYLFWQIEGGERASKGFEHRLALFGGEVAVPVGGFAAQYDRSPLSFIKRVLGSGTGGGKYFVGKPKGGDMPDGVWMRSGKKLRMVMTFDDNATYEERLDLPGIAQDTVAQRWEPQLLRALNAPARA